MKQEHLDTGAAVSHWWHHLEPKCAENWLPDEAAVLRSLMTQQKVKCFRSRTIEIKSSGIQHCTCVGFKAAHYWWMDGIFFCGAKAQGELNYCCCEDVNIAKVLSACDAKMPVLASFEKKYKTEGGWKNRQFERMESSNCKSNNCNYTLQNSQYFNKLWRVEGKELVPISLPLMATWASLLSCS